LINIDFADFRTILDGKGRLAYLNTVEVQKKEGSTKDLITRALNSPLFPYSIKGGKGVLLNISGEKELSLSDVAQISKTISDLVNPEAKIIFGVSQSKQYSNILKITLMVTGCSLKIFSKLGGKKRKKKLRVIRTASPSSPEKKEVKPKKKRKPRKIEAVEKPKPKKRKKLRVKKEKKEASVSHPAKEEKPEASQDATEEKVRKNALQIKKESEEVEKEMVEKEKFWETPAFLRKKIIKGQ